MGLGNGPRQRRLDGHFKLAHVAVLSVSALGAVHAKHADPGPRMPAHEGPLGEQQQGGIGHSHPAASGQDQAKLAQRIFRRPVTIDGTGKEIASQIKIKVVQRCFRLHPAVVTHGPVSLFPLVDHFLRLQPNLVADAVRKSVTLDHYGLGFDVHFDDDDLLVAQHAPLVSNRHCRTKPAVRHGQEFGDCLLGITVPRRGTVVVHAQQQRTAVRVGKSRDVLGDDVSHSPALDDLPRSASQVPERLELLKLTLVLLEKVVELGFGKQLPHRSAYPALR